MQLYHVNKCIKVTRISDQELLSECTVLSTEQEAVAWVVANIADLHIKKAKFSQYRSPTGTVINEELPELIGVEAYLNAGTKRKELLAMKEQSLARDLLAECINGVVQSETFFFNERGFADAETFFTYWDEMYVNSCLRFSHPDPQDLFKDKIGYMDRSPQLFMRISDVAVYQEPDYGYLILATFNDSHHELSMRLNASKDGIVRSSSAVFNRVPYKVCKETIRSLERIIGLRIVGMSKKAIAAQVGGPEGCQHIVETVFDSSQALNVVLDRTKN